MSCRAQVISASFRLGYSEQGLVGFSGGYRWSFEGILCLRTVFRMLLLLISPQRGLEADPAGPTGGTSEKFGRSEPASAGQLTLRSQQIFKLTRGTNGAGDRCDSRLERLETGEVDRDLRPRRSKAQQHLIPTPRQSTLWENVQQAKLRGLSLRAISRELGIHRNTARKYALSESPPLRKIKSATGTPQPETGTLTSLDIFADQLGGHFRWTSTQVR